MTEYLKTEKEGHVLRVTLDRPERRNALSTPVCERLLQLPDEIEADMEVRCVVITGAGEAFCAGADLKERRELDEEGRWRYVELVDRALMEIEAIPVPVIAAVNGHALGGGTELALGCDLRLAVSDADFGLTETALGIIPTGSIVRLLRDGHDAVNALLTYTAQRFSAARMADFGFVHHVVGDRFELDDLADELAAAIVGNAPLALRAAKRVRREATAARTAEAMSRAEAIRRDLDDTEDCREGLAAFAEKRAPVFRGS